MCCGSVEHVLPLFERYRSSVAPRQALDYAWECAFGRSPSGEDIERLSGSASAAIPVVAEGGRPEARLCMRSAVGVLETLQYLGGVEAAGRRACAAVLDALVVAADLMDTAGRLAPDRPFLEAIENGSGIPTLVSEEILVQRRMVEEVHTWADGRLGPVWREEHRRRGRAIAERLGERFTPR